MIDRALANMNPIQADTYYFQLYPLNLTIVGKESVAPPPGTTYRFTVFKGQQKFDESKLPIEANFFNVNDAEVMVMPKCPLNFYVPSFNKNKKVEFVLKLYQTQDNEEYDLGEYAINIEPYISQFRQDRTVRFQLNSPFSDDYELQFQIYVERTRFALEKVVKDFKVERGLKSPLRERVAETITPNMRKVLTGPRSPGPTQSPVVVDYPLIDDEKGSKVGIEVQSNISEAKQEKESQIQQIGWTAAASKGPQSQVQTDKASQAFSRQNKSGLKSKDSQSSYFQEKSVKRESKIQNKSNKKQNRLQSDKYSQDDVSEKRVPSVDIRLSKPVKTNAPAEVRLADSTRMYTGPVLDTPDEPTKPLPTKDWKQQAIMAIFLTVSLILMYLAMHPSKKV